MIQKYSLLGYVTREAQWWVPGLWPQHTAFSFWWPVQTHPECSSKTFIATYQTIRCANPHHIMNPRNLEYIKSCAKDYLEYLMYKWKCHTRKTGLQKSSMFSTNMVFKIMYFFPQKTEETKSETLSDHRHHQYTYTFWGQDNIWWISKDLLQAATRKITHSKQPL
jgi:hypothetical protein